MKKYLEKIFKITLTIFGFLTINILGFVFSRMLESRFPLTVTLSLTFGAAGLWFVIFILDPLLSNLLINRLVKRLSKQRMKDGLTHTQENKTTQVQPIETSPNILHNKQAMAFIQETAEKLRAMGLIGLVTTNDLGKFGMSVSLHIGETIFAVAAARVAQAEGSVAPHLADENERTRFDQAVADYIA